MTAILRLKLTTTIYVSCVCVFPALFLSDGAPFNFPGFSILCVGLAWVRISSLYLAFLTFNRQILNIMFDFSRLHYIYR